MRISVGQIRLRNLTVLDLIHKAAARLNINEIISDFAKEKAQKYIFNLGYHCQLFGKNKYVNFRKINFFNAQ